MKENIHINNFQFSIYHKIITIYIRKICVFLELQEQHTIFIYFLMPKGKTKHLRWQKFKSKSVKKNVEEWNAKK